MSSKEEGALITAEEEVAKHLKVDNEGDKHENENKKKEEKKRWRKEQFA